MKTKIALGVVGTLTLAIIVAYTQGAFAIVAPSEPVLVSLSPAQGTVAGGQLVTLTGTDLDDTNTVSFAGLSAEIQSISSTQVTVLTPAHAEGTVDVTLATTYYMASLPQSYTYIVEPPAPELLCKKGKKNAVCHVPDQNIDNEHTICIPDSALQAHFRKYPVDYMGGCKNGR